MIHAILLGDSIFDNARYVPGGPPVIEQVRQHLPAGGKATLLAVDGHVAADVPGQARGVPPDATHLFVSVGGNDALGSSGVLQASVRSVAEALLHFDAVQAEFRRDYDDMLRAVLSAGRPTALCTIYESVPGLSPAERLGLGVFNDVILRAAFTAGLPVIDLRLLCTRPDDYSSVSPIEPSVAGGFKIARAIAQVATTHDFSQRRTAIYGAP